MNVCLSELAVGTPYDVTQCPDQFRSRTRLVGDNVYQYTYIHTCVCVYVCLLIIDYFINYYSNYCIYAAWRMTMF